MRLLPELEQWRIRRGYHATESRDPFGAFIIPKRNAPAKTELRIIASSGDVTLGIEWEHVSISTEFRCPYWLEMDFVKRLFWDDEEAVMQLHPPRSRWVNNHEFCLHLWRPITQVIPLPPTFAVGLPSKTQEEVLQMGPEKAREMCERELKNEKESA